MTPIDIYPYAKSNFATKTFLELLEFQGSWNLIGQEKIGYALVISAWYNQAEILNQFAGS